MQIEPIPNPPRRSMISSADCSSIAGTLEVSVKEPTRRPPPPSLDPADTAQLPVFERPIGYDLLIALG